MIILIITLIILVAFSTFALISHFRLDITNYIIKNAKITRDFKIVQLSDLHSREFRNDNKKIIDYIEKEKPDIIVMTGDMINAKNGDIAYLEKFINKLKEICKIYYVMGNREFRYNEDEFNKLISMLEENSVKVLNNSSDTINKNGNEINIYGLNYNNRNIEKYYEFRRGSIYNKKYEIKNKLEDVFSIIDKDKYNILLTHSPNAFKKYASFGFDLIISGHIHGGVIRLPFAGGLLSPNATFFPKYDAGLFFEEGSVMCVSRGMGYGSLPFRILNNPEIVVINLKHS